MSNIINLTVVDSKATKKGNFYNKLIGEAETVTTPFGEVLGGKKTYYMFTDTENTKGLSAEIDLAAFEQVTSEYTYTDDADGKKKVATLTYLYPLRK